MQYLNFDLEIAPGMGRDYPVSVQSETGQMQGTLHLPFGELEMENALLKLEKALLQSGGIRRKVLTVEEAGVQQFGQALFEALLAGDLRSLYYESKREAARQGNGLRIRIHLRAPELAALPWEYLYDPRVPDYLCLSRSTVLVRFFDLAHPLEPLSVAPPLQILAMVASPKDQEVLDTARERERMRQALEPLEKRGLVTLTWLEGQTWRDLQRAMRGGPWHIFHFIGHGAFDRRIDEGALALADDNGQTYLLHATLLGRMLADHGKLRLVVLNACEGAKGGQRDLFSSTAATLAQRGIPAVLAMQYEISDRAAIELTRTFYESLADALGVDAALAEARIAINLGINNSLEWGIPVLFMRAPDGTIFQFAQPLNQQTGATGQSGAASLQAASGLTKRQRRRSPQKPKPGRESMIPLSAQALAEAYDAVVGNRITDIPTIERIILQFEAVAADPELSKQVPFDAAAGARKLVNHLYYLQMRTLGMSSQQGDRHPSPVQPAFSPADKAELKPTRLALLSTQELAETYDAIVRRRITDAPRIRFLLAQFEAVAADPELSQQVPFDAAEGARNLRNALHHLSQQLKTPDLIGKPFEEAAALLSQQQLILRVKGERYYPNLPPGHVIQQDPLPGTLIRYEEEVLVTLSKL